MGATNGTTSASGASSTSTTGAESSSGALDSSEGGAVETMPVTDSGALECVAGVCLPPAPADWNGPAVFVDSEDSNDSPGCPDSFPEEVAMLHDELVAPAAECACECGDALGASCDTLVLEFHGADSTCLGGANDEYVIGSSCEDEPSVTNSSRFWSVDQPGLVGGACSPTAETTVPGPTWTTDTLVCGMASSRHETCEGGRTCVPTPPSDSFSSVCIWRPGSFECPAGGFTEQFVRYSTFTDDRDCSACSCDSPEGDCVGNVRLWPSDDCSGGLAAGTVPVGGGCIASVDSVSSADRGSISVADASCAPLGGEAIGEAAPSDPHTFCCLPR